MIDKEVLTGKRRHTATIIGGLFSKHVVLVLEVEVMQDWSTYGSEYPYDDDMRGTRTIWRTATVSDITMLEDL